jgi:hypothetical protein
MSLQKQQDFLARLFTDEGLRQNFLSKPDKIGAENGLSETETQDLKSVLPEEIGFFADSLFWKRLREVEKLLPLTKKVLREDFTKYFREFSPTFNPQTVKKHFEDALAFSEFLQNQTIEPLWAKDLAKFEFSRLIFNSDTKKFVFTRFNHDIREIIREVSHRNSESQANFRRKTTFAIWLKIRKKTKHFVW